MNEVITLGFIDKGTGKHQSNIVYFRGGVVRQYVQVME